MEISLHHLIEEIRSCKLCAEQLPLGPRPVLEAAERSKIVIIGQAPGSIVHKSGKPWDDKSGENLRRWLAVDEERFYDPQLFAIIPMGFCYPGRGKTGDLPPLKICAQTWHDKLLEKLEEGELILLVGKYAQDYYLKKSYRTLTENVKNFHDFLPRFFPLPHPSPRNNIWQAKNQWFSSEVIPNLQEIVQRVIK